MIETYVVRPLLYLVIAMVFLSVLKLWMDRATPYQDDREIVEKGNLAIALQRIGIYLALVIALFGSLDRTRDNTLREDLTWFALDGLVALATLLLCSKANDLLILRHDRNCLELQEGNRAVGIVEAGAYIATGSILAGAFGGDGGGIASAIVFATLGQVALVFLYWFHSWRTSYDLNAEIKRGNIACACTVAGELIAAGVILRASIAGPFVSWASDFSTFGISLVAALVLLWLTRLLVDWLFLPKTTIGQQVQSGNIAVGALVAGLTAGASLAVASVI